MRNKLRPVADHHKPASRRLNEKPKQVSSMINDCAAFHFFNAVLSNGYNFRKKEKKNFFCFEIFLLNYFWLTKLKLLDVTVGDQHLCQTHFLHPFSWAIKMRNDRVLLVHKLICIYLPTARRKLASGGQTKIFFTLLSFAVKFLAFYVESQMHLVVSCTISICPSHVDSVLLLKSLPNRSDN